MYCPKCGAESSTGLNFCRRCGLSLQRVSAALSAEFTPAELEPEDDEDRRRALRRAFRILPFGVLLLFSGIIVIIIGSDLLHEKIVETVGVIALLLGILISALGFLNPALFEKPSPKRRKQELPDMGQAALPEQRFVADVPSVTEGTTRELAEREPARRREGGVA
jgi:hypothetical protein